MKAGQRMNPSLTEERKRQKEIFGRNLTYYMDSNSIRVNKLAEVLGTHSSTVTSWRKGRIVPRMESIRKICEFMNLHTADLLFDHVSDNYRRFYGAESEENIEEKKSYDEEVRKMKSLAKELSELSHEQKYIVLTQLALIEYGKAETEKKNENK